MEILELIFQFIVEVVLQVFFEGVCDLTFGNTAADREVWRLLLYAGVGAVAGGVSLQMFPAHIIPGAVRYTSVVVIPIGIGWCMRAVGRGRRERGGSEFGLEAFWPAWAFAFAFGLVRLKCAG